MTCVTHHLGEQSPRRLRSSSWYRSGKWRHWCGDTFQLWVSGIVRVEVFPVALFCILTKHSARGCVKSATDHNYPMMSDWIMILLIGRSSSAEPCMKHVMYSVVLMTMKRIYSSIWRSRQNLCCCSGKKYSCGFSQYVSNVWINCVIYLDMDSSTMWWSTICCTQCFFRSLFVYLCFLCTFTWNGLWNIWGTMYHAVPWFWTFIIFLFIILKCYWGLQLSSKYFFDSATFISLSIGN